MAEEFSWSGLLAPDSPFMQEAGDIGWGLLANSGVLPGNTPGGGGFGARLGRAGMYAGERQNERVLNEARRIEIESAKREQQGLAEFKDWLAANPDASMDDRMNAVIQFMPEQAAKGYAANIGNPLLGVEAELKKQNLASAKIAAQTAEVEGEAAKFKLSQEKADTRTVYGQLRTADKAFERLKQIPGADAILVNPIIAGLIRTGVSGSKLTNKITELAATGIWDISKEDLPDALSAVELISKARYNVGSATGGAVQSQANAMKGLGEGVGLDEQHFVFKENLENTKLQMQENRWEPPAEPKYPFYKAAKPDETTSTAGGYVPGAPRVNPVTTVTVPPPAAPPADETSWVPDWMTEAPGAAAGAATDLFNRGVAAAPGAIDATTGAATRGYNATAPVVAGAVRQGAEAVQQGVEAARPVVGRAAAATAKAGKDALATAQTVPAEAMKIVKRVGKMGLNAAGVPVYQRWDDAARAVANGELTHASTPTGYVIIGGKIVDIRP